MRLSQKTCSLPVLYEETAKVFVLIVKIDSPPENRIWRDIRVSNAQHLFAFKLYRDQINTLIVYI